MDAQSVKNASTSGTKGYDNGKRISGIKRHIAVDSQGLPHAIGVTAASVNDRTGALEILEKYKQNMTSVETVLTDGGYTGKPFHDSVSEKIHAIAEIAKRSELHKFAVIPKRWVVERSFAWIENRRRCWKNCERLLSSSVGMLQLAFIRILLKRF